MKTFRIAALLVTSGALFANINFPPSPLFTVGQSKDGSLIVGCPGSTVVYSSASDSFTVTEVAQPNATTHSYRVTNVRASSSAITINITSPQGCTNPPPPSFTFPVTTGDTAPTTLPPTFYINPYSTAFQHPVSGATGELFGHDDDADLFVEGPLSLELRRYYASYLTGNGVRSALGNNWMHNFDVSLSLSTASALVRLFRGDVVQFTRAGNVFTLTGRERVNYQLIASGADFRFYSPQSNLIYTFNSTGALIKVEDRNGNALTVARGPNGPTVVDDGEGRTLIFTYTGARLTRVQDQAARAVTFEYAGEQLANFTDANGKRSIYSYTAVGNLTGLMTNERRPVGNTPFVNEYDAQGRIARQLDSRANAMAMTYNVTPGTTGIAHPLNVNVSVTHDGQRNTTRLTDGNGQSANYTYDDNDRPTALVDRLGNRTTATYDAAGGRPTSYTDEEGNTTTYTYTATTRNGFTFHDLTGIRNPDGTTVALTRDERGYVATVTDEAGRVWRVTRNARGQVETLTTPTGGVTTFTYLPVGTLTSIRNDAGGTARFTYDNAKRPTLVTHPDSTTTALQYDARDNVTRVTDERGNARSLAFDDNNNPLRSTDAIGAIHAVTYDADDRVASALDANGRAALFTYDAVSRLATATNAAGDRVTFNYDGLNRPTSILDATGKGDAFTWDRENRLATVSDALARVTRLTRDRRGLVTRVTTPNNENYDFTYDGRGRPASSTNPLGETSQVRYDQRGMLQSVSRSGGINATLERNETGLITKLTDPNGNAWNREFDKLGRMTSSTDPLGRVTTYEYDARQRLAFSELPASDVKFFYDNAGNLVQQLYSDGTQLPYTYDAENRLLTSTGLTLAYDRNGDISNSNGLAIERDAARRITAITYASGKVLRYTYDTRGLVTRVTDWVGGFTEIAYNDARQVTSITYPNTFRREFTYDRNGRVATIRFVRQAVNGEITLRRDADGKVVSADRTARYIPDPANGYLPLAYDAAHQTFGATHDPLGRVTDDGPRKYEWDLASRLKGYSGADGSADFAYDGLGQRIGRSSGGVSQSYALNYAMPLPTVATVRQGTSDLRHYIWLPDGRLIGSIEATGNARRFYHFDETGSTILITDDAAAVVDSLAITPYGETVERTGTFDNPFTWQGEFGVIQEGSTGLFYMRARWYDSASARFLSKDPVSSLDPKKMSPYQYATGDPMRFGDPSGLIPSEIVLSINTAEFTNLTTGAVRFTNGPKTLQAVIINRAFDGKAPLNYSAGSGNVLNTTPLFATSAFDTGTPDSYPSFAQADAGPASVANIVSASTTLLVPFAVRDLGFDTGIALSNTTSDPFGTGNQTGACQLNYFGNTSGGGTAPAASPTPRTGSFALNSEILGPGFQGYIISQCGFQYAHGFAFISDVGAQRLAHGYLALVLDQASQSRTLNTSEILGH